jgi:hypothetical protein
VGARASGGAVRRWRRAGDGLMGVSLWVDVLNKGICNNVSTICKKWLFVNWTVNDVND